MIKEEFTDEYAFVGVGSFICTKCGSACTLEVLDKDKGFEPLEAKPSPAPSLQQKKQTGLCDECTVETCDRCSSVVTQCDGFTPPRKASDYVATESENQENKFYELLCRALHGSSIGEHTAAILDILADSLSDGDGESQLCWNLIRESTRVEKQEVTEEPKTGMNKNCGNCRFKTCLIRHEGKVCRRWVSEKTLVPEEMKELRRLGGRHIWFHCGWCEYECEVGEKCKLKTSEFHKFTGGLGACNECDRRKVCDSRADTITYCGDFEVDINLYVSEILKEKENLKPDTVKPIVEGWAGDIHDTVKQGKIPNGGCPSCKGCSHRDPDDPEICTVLKNNSQCPKDRRMKPKSKDTVMDFQNALTALKMGSKVKRVGWTDCWVHIVGSYLYFSLKKGNCNLWQPNPGDILATDWMLHIE